MRHRFHSICPYFAMFPESFAETWISNLTKRGDTVEAVRPSHTGIGRNPIAFLP